MPMNRKLFPCILAFALTACSEPGQDQGRIIGMPNPASVHCENSGGTLVLQTQEDGGVFGLCTLPGGAVCEEWALFRGECPAASPPGAE